MDDYTAQPEEAPPPRPNFLNRLWMVFVQPTRLFEALGKNPAWFPMTLFVAVGMGAVFTLVPPEVWEAQIAAGGVSGADLDDAAAGARIAAPIGTLLAFLVIPLVISAFTYMILVFLRGDNARFKQHLSVISHVGIVGLAGSAVHLPLWIRTASFETTLSIGTFFPFLSDGFLFAFLTELQLFYLWMGVAAGIGLAALDPQRSAGSTVAIMLVIQVILALACAGCATAFSPSF